MKVKFHHLLHLPEDLLRMGCVASCFACERKHRDWKRNSVYAFRHVEHQSTTDFLNYAVREIVSGRFKFNETCLVGAKEFSMYDGAFRAQFSDVALTRAGEVRAGDVVALVVDGLLVVGEMVKFFSAEDGACLALVLRYSPTRKPLEFDIRSCSEILVKASALCARCIWAKRRPGVLLVLVPDNISIAFDS